MDTVDKTKLSRAVSRGLVVLEASSVVLLSVAIGAVGTLLFLRIKSGFLEQISTGELFFGALVFTLLLAAVVLALHAIRLCRLAELSTSRIEAIIQLAGMKSARMICGKADELHADFDEEILPDEAIGWLPDKELRKLAEHKYFEFREIILLGIKNSPGIVTIKVGEGCFSADGEEMVDGLFKMDRERIAFCSFCTNPILADRFSGSNGDLFARLLGSLFEELHAGRFTRVFLAFDNQLKSDSVFAQRLNEFRQKIGTAMFRRFEVFEGLPAVIIPVIIRRIGDLKGSAPPDEHTEPGG